MADVSVNNQRANLNIGPYGTQNWIKISKIGLHHVLSWSKLGLVPKFHDTGTCRYVDIHTRTFLPLMIQIQTYTHTRARSKN